jgi:hypothetical protein
MREGIKFTISRGMAKWASTISIMSLRSHQGQYSLDSLDDNFFPTFVCGSEKGPYERGLYGGITSGY